ncbi:MAG: MBL fold metallo-hydrolase [bacterium]|nr:MBL fold metallo-hydrolase [bacterium]
MIKKVLNKVSMIFTDEGFLASNGVLVEDDVRLVIDSAEGKVLESVYPETVEVLLNSHHHLDHISGNDLFVNAKIMAHPIEREAMKNPEKTSASFGWKELMEPEKLSFVDQLQGSDNRNLKPWNVDEDLHDGQVIDCGSTKIRVVLTPGHTGGHCSFYFPEEEFIFIGDICLSKVGPWYGDPDTDVDDFIRSVDKIIELKPKMLATSHIPDLLIDGTDDIKGILTEYKERVYSREKRILDFLHTHTANINEISEKKLIYRVHPSTFVEFWEKSMVKKHLHRLLDAGKIEKLDDGRYCANERESMSEEIFF